MSGIFRVNTESKILEPLGETDLAAHGFKERYDLQEWITTYPQILGEDLLIISKECSSFDCTNERADLVALDAEGNIVIIELKRDDSGTDVHWQAIKYASYFSRASGESLVELFQHYSDKLSLDEALQRINTFTQQDDPSMLNRKQRIILVSHRFAREVTSAVLWLRDNYKVDIRCIQLIPFSDPISGSFYLQSKTIIPVPGTEGFEITIGLPTGNSSASTRYGNKGDDESVYMASVFDATNDLIDATLRPNRRSRWAGTWANLRYYKAWYSHAPWSNHEFSYESHIVFHSDGTRGYDVRFSINPSTAVNKELTQEDIEVIRSSMRDFAASHKLEFTDHPNHLRILYYMPAPELDEALRKKAAKMLAELITNFTPLVEDLFSSKNQQDL